MSCGLLSDLSHNIDKGLMRYLDDIMTCLLQVLRSNDYHIDVKLVGIIALGDVCLASEDMFGRYIDASMECLFSAGTLALSSLD